MITPFFAVAAQAPRRQFAFRALVAFHLIVLVGGAWLARESPPEARPLLGLIMLVAGIVEGALLIGWRLTQLPKSRALEFLLASPLRPAAIFAAEALVGVTRLLFLTLAGVPFYLVLMTDGLIDLRDLFPLLAIPFTWGLVAGLALTAWAFEPLWLRRIGERFIFACILLYLVVGFVAGEHLGEWVNSLPTFWQTAILESFYFFHRNNPFAVMYFNLRLGPGAEWERTAWLVAASWGVIALVAVRGAWRMEGHFRERHYSPVADVRGQKRQKIGDYPLVWWAVRRVSEYSGKANLWLAVGFGTLYACHLLAGDFWPAWMGRQVFRVFDQFFGVAGVATALVVLGSVPAAFQYGLWDSSAQDRCRRLELLLLTQLNARDFWGAAIAAAWKRGKGYLYVAALLWLAAAVGGQISFSQVVLALLASMILWLFYFTLGFRAFSTGMQANNLGLILTAILPLLTWGLFKSGWTLLACLTPPGMVYAAGSMDNALYCFPGLVVAGLLTLYVERRALSQCLEELRKWYGLFHGQKVID
jgi:hypothetical protein